MTLSRLLNRDERHRAANGSTSGQDEQREMVQLATMHDPDVRHIGILKRIKPGRDGDASLIQRQALRKPRAFRYKGSEREAARPLK
jgi:hypothetical protein